MARSNNLEAVEPVRSVARAVGASPAQVALAWVLAQGEDVIPIPGTKRPRYLEENLAALDVTLDTETMSSLSRLVATGDRYGSASTTPGVPVRRR